MAVVGVLTYPVTMRVELIPVILGAIVLLAGLGIVWDAWQPETIVLTRERRRRERAERHRPGQALLGVGAAAMGAALMGRDGWRYATLAVIVGAVALLVGAILNRRYLAEGLTFRGALRRDATTQVKPGMPEQTPPRHARFK
ncbi:MAG: hypothetical protein NVS4B3_09550 [Gemmatimonadaceae bacterium]